MTKKIVLKSNEIRTVEYVAGNGQRTSSIGPVGQIQTRDTRETRETQT